MKRAFRHTLKPLFVDSNPWIRRCDHLGCDRVGEFRAPKDRTLQDYHWFCLDHVRAYNAQWDFYKGMSGSEIEAHQHGDLTWQRPSWSFYPTQEINIRREFRIFEGLGRKVQATEEERLPFPPNSKECFALQMFKLDYPFTQEQMKAAYKALVKIHHPDLHGGKEEAQEKLKQINEYYDVLLVLIRR